jgi:hypothetical protein
MSGLKYFPDVIILAKETATMFGSFVGLLPFPLYSLPAPRAVSRGIVALPYFMEEGLRYVYPIVQANTPIN